MRALEVALFVVALSVAGVTMVMLGDNIAPATTGTRLGTVYLTLAMLTWAVYATLLRLALGAEETILLAFDRAGAFPEQMAQLRALGCGFGQGFHMAQPLNEHDAGVWLRGPRGALH